MLKTKNKDPILRVARGKRTHHLQPLHRRLTADFSPETAKGGRQWGGIFKVWGGGFVNQEFSIQQNYLSKIKAK